MGAHGRGAFVQPAAGRNALGIDVVADLPGDSFEIQSFVAVMAVLSEAGSPANAVALAGVGYK